MSDRATLYAEALVSVIAAEGNINEVQDELFRFSRALEGHDELRQVLSDPHIPAERRQQIVQDLLEGKASDTTLGIVAMLVATGRIKELPTIVDRLLEFTATRTNKAIAEVRSAVELDETQRARLAEALKAKLGHEVDLVVIVDPTVLGGIVTQVGDTVIDGSVRHRLAQLKESF
ncbi:MAG: ATP synthase F1 subunit delta [Acidimicrobiales bacterium]|nr:ATP synthase F1 subunit delta [Acidimicrobiales bacterium]